MDRRRFLRNGLLVAGGAIAADQLELADRLGWTRRLFPGADVGRPVTTTEQELNALLRRVYTQFRLDTFAPSAPLWDQLPRRPGVIHATVSLDGRVRELVRP
jgi:hypothetical protein